jgi:hypothetical protein
VLPVKIQGDSYTFDIAESEYDNQIAPATAHLNGGGRYLNDKKAICWFLIAIYNVK